jgi:hypothetical protein
VSLTSFVDHLVVAAESLERGVQWCNSTLGVVPGAGGEHALMGTHNRVLRLATVDYPRCYLEIIAIDKAATPPRRKRWFDLDDPVLRHQVRQQPRLVHFVARTASGEAALKALRNLGIERGPLLPAERASPAGLLRWQISVRRDGQRLFYGGLPTLIEWGAVHPADHMPDVGVCLQSLRVSHPRAADLRAAHAALGLQGVSVEEGAPNLVATLATPIGLVTLESGGA